MADEEYKGPCIICGCDVTSQWKEVPEDHEQYPGRRTWVCKGADCFRVMGWKEPKKKPGRKPRTPLSASPPGDAATEAPTNSRKSIRKPPLFIADIKEIRGVR